ncbi:MAG: AraC family ligand binding domain-containing protein, partial [Firmicutes bacterium]|nr:AraC family ligand binding domain-containing protein [Bacillota bacterium]
MVKRNVIRTTDVPVDERRREITSHGTRAFPVAIYYDVLKENVLGYVNWHWHEELQFCLVAQGFVDFFVGSKHICLGEGQGLFINSRALHMIRPGSEDAIYICLNYSPLLLGLYPGSVFHEKYVMPFISSEVAAIEFGKDLDWHT